MSDSSDPFARISAYYNSRVDRFGHDPRSCDYGRPESQQIKFKVLSQVLPLAGKSVLDIGCGFADYATFLASQIGNVAYTGFDLSPRMIEEAKQLHRDLDLRVRNILTDPPSLAFDVVTANGIFYLLGAQAQTLMHDLIRAMFTAARHAVAFNSLSSWATDQEAGEFYADPLATAAFCHSLTPRLVLRHDYHTRDFTLFLYKSEAP
jgi:SAM-dependent methyltransferase